MLWPIAKIILASGVISFSSWLAGKRPDMAGFIIALPISSILALIFNFAEFQDPSKSSAFAKSIFLAVPLSLLFFVPFLVADRFKLSFPLTLILGIVLLGVGYGLHSLIFKSI